MLNTRIHRYISREVLAPALLCILIFTIVLLMGRLVQLVELVVNKGVSIGDITVLFATMLPSLMSISLPLAFLMGIMIGLGRVSADSETVALKAAGFGLGNIAVPVFALALVFAILTGIAGFWGKPWSYSAFKTKIFDITRKKATVGIQSGVFMDQFEDLVLYTNDIKGRSGVMSDLAIVQREGEKTSWIYADKGTILTDDKNETVTIRLYDGVIHHQQGIETDKYQLIHFKSYDIQPDLTAVNTPLIEQKKRPKEVPTGELWELVSSEKGLQKQTYQAELHHRLCSPFAPLLFALFGLPFSIQSHRSGRSGGFVMGLVIYLCYYALLSFAETMTAKAGASPLYTFWAIHLLLAVVGVVLLRQSSLERTNAFVRWVDQTVVSIKNRARSHVND